MSSQVRFAVLGLGHIGKKHCDIILQHPDTQLVACCDNAKNDMTITHFSSLDELLASSIPIDVISICTPSGLHAEQAIKILEHNCNILCEKPLALSTYDAEQIIQAAENHQKKVFCVMQNRFSPLAQWLHSMVASNKLGKIYLVDIHCLWNRNDEYYSQSSWHGNPQLDGGMLFTQFSHYIDTVLWTFGNLSHTQSRFYKQTHSFFDVGTVMAETKSGACVTMNFCTNAYRQSLESSITIVAEKGTIKISGQYMDKLEYCDVENCKIPTFAPNEHPNHWYVFQNVVDVLRNDAPIAVSAEESLQVIRTIEQIYIHQE